MNHDYDLKTHLNEHAAAMNREVRERWAAKGTAPLILGIDRVLDDDYAEIYAVISEAARLGLVTEVLWTAMHHLQAHPTTSIADALTIGLLEWDV